MDWAIFIVSLRLFVETKEIHGYYFSFVFTFIQTYIIKHPALFA